ncbi:conserved hypothetical protein [Ricinus communis]|uniref:RNase H type-1 domain-containing protein n=1 Tax=Ricinus communis TaxID=3988 RepID=B9T0K3_RICCO|nr:conserved hypothetical protein [Ricinus communis]
MPNKAADCLAELAHSSDCPANCIKFSHTQKVNKKQINLEIANVTDEPTDGQASVVTADAGLILEPGSRWMTPCRICEGSNHYEELEWEGDRGKSLQVQKMLFETDAKRVTDALSFTAGMKQWDVDPIISDIHHVLGYFENSRVSLIDTRANAAAHWIAKNKSMGFFSSESMEDILYSDAHSRAV